MEGWRSPTTGPSEVLSRLSLTGKTFCLPTLRRGATGSSIMFSVIQTAIENGLDPYKYLTWLMKTAKDTNLTDEKTIQMLLPWNAPAECRTKQKTSLPALEMATDNRVFFINKLWL